MTSTKNYDIKDPTLAEHRFDEFHTGIYSAEFPCRAYDTMLIQDNE